ARVLARAGRRAGRRVTLRRASWFVAAALVICSSVAGAWTAAAWIWRAPTPATAKTLPSQDPEPHAPRRSVRVIPSVDPAEAENSAYGRAHRAHFVDDAPAPALAAW